MNSSKALWLVVIGSTLGILFASVSTYDFVQHLDRQVHGVHCSFVPGLGNPDISGTSGCQATMMSPYSSVWRQTLWGGLPISLPAISVFAFLLFLAFELIASGRSNHRQATGMLLLATLVPALTSAVMAYIALATLGAACKLCIGIYVASGLCLLGAFMTWYAAKQYEHLRLSALDNDDALGDLGEDDETPHLPLHQAPPLTSGHVFAAIGLGVVFVALPVGAYVAAAPDQDRFIAQCGTLDYPGDRYEVMVPVGPQSGGAPVIEVLDPLCPACRAFEQHLGGTGLDARLNRQMLLFPLDNACNWMVESAVHPGACTVSEAVLCAGDQAGEVIAWAFAEQDAIRAATAQDPRAAKRMVQKAFPKLARCVGGAAVRARLNKSLRWAVSNRLPLMTPQLYIAGVKLCDEDLDLGLEYALSFLLRHHQQGTLPQVKTKLAPEPPAFMQEEATADAAAPDTLNAEEALENLPRDEAPDSQTPGNDDPDTAKQTDRDPALDNSDAADQDDPDSEDLSDDEQIDRPSVQPRADDEDSFEDVAEPEELPLEPSDEPDDVPQDSPSPPEPNEFPKEESP
ncbi:MAG: vitamin K epoxide reductase family protein [Myxococcota bacterium]